MKISSMGRIDDYKPALAMIGLQFSFAGVNLFTKASLLKGLSPTVFVFYRQGIATMFIVSIAFVSRKKNLFRSSLGWKSFGWIFLSSFLGVTVKQNIYAEGLYLSSTIIASTMANLTPALTFVLGTILGLEKINIKSLTSFAKILGTIFCVGGAISMALLKPKHLFSLGGENWLLGCSLLFGCSLLWSLWVILQVPISASCPDHLYSSSWMGLLATLQSGTVALLAERKLEAWSLNSYLELTCCFYTGIVLAITFYVQAWCVPKRGPLYSVMFYPLSTVIVAFFDALFLHEETYTGSLVSAFAVIAGLYIVLWGKARDLVEMKQETDSRMLNNQTNIAQVLTEESSERNCRIDLEKPFLSETSNT